MKTLYQFLQESFITESKIDSLKKKWVGKLSTIHDPSTNYQIIDDSDHPIKLRNEVHNNVIDLIHQADPHPRKSNVDWLVKQYHKGDYGIEDLYSVQDTLKDYSRFKDALPVEQRELNNHTLSSLRNALRPLKEKGTKKSRKEEKIIQGATLLHNNNGVKVYQAHTMEASCELGAGMPWCTANRDPKLNKFNHLTSKGEKHYIVHLPNEEAPFRKLGIIFEKNELQDENNINTERNGNIHDIIKRNPELMEIPEFQGKRLIFTKDHKSYKDSLIRNDLVNYAEKYGIKNLSNKNLKDIVDSKIQHNIDYLGDHIDIDRAKEAGIHNDLMHSYLFKKRYIKHTLYNDIKNLNSQQLKEYISNNSPLVSNIIGFRKKLKSFNDDVSKHIIMNDKTIGFMNADKILSSHINLTEDEHKKIYNNLMNNIQYYPDDGKIPGWNMVNLRAAAKLPNLKSHQVQEIIDKEKLLKSLKLDGMYKRDPLLWLTKQKTLDPVHKKYFLSHPNGAVKAAAIQNMDLSPEELNRFKDDKNLLVKRALAKKNRVVESKLYKISGLLK